MLSLKSCSIHSITSDAKLDYTAVFCAFQMQLIFYGYQLYGTDATGRD